MRLQAALLALGLALAACVTAPRGPFTITAIDTYGGHDLLRWSVASDGAAYYRDAQREFRFTLPPEYVSRVEAVARRVIEAGAYDCPTREGHSVKSVAITEGGGEQQKRYDIGCGDANELSAASAFFAMGEDLHVQAIAAANSRPLTPTSITVRYLTWGSARTWWSITRDGEGRHFADGVEHTFHTPADAFDRIYTIMRPWQSDSVHCSNAPTDGPYGEITFAAGEDERRSGWRAGCSSANSDDLYRRLDEANNAIHALMNAPPAN